MTRRARRLLAPSVFLSIAAASMPGIVRAESQDFHLVDQSVEVNRTDGIATFSLTFDQHPSFVAIDSGQLKAFQYEIDVNSEDATKPIGFDQIDTIIRGAEIWEGQGIPVRERDGNGGAHAGGWGPVRAMLPFNVDDNTNTLTFSTPLSTLGDTDGKFRYRLFTTDNGGLTTDIQAAAIPLPLAAPAGAVLLGATCAAGRLRELARRRQRWLAR
jgi:hypothetical protein